VIVDSGIASSILTSAGAGTALIVILLLTGLLATGQAMKRMERESDGWKGAYEAERAARVADHAAAEELRKAVVVQTQRADAAVEVAKLTKELLEGLRRRRDETTAA
jgi:hypothetical protein